MTKTKVKSKPASDRSTVIMTELVLPQHTNALGTIFGGVIMGWVDIAAAIACTRYARSPVVTVSVDSLSFLQPVKLGHTVIIEARVTYTGKTSMEVEVTVWGEIGTEGTKFKTTQAYLTFVAIDSKGGPIDVPPFIPDTKDEKERYIAAKKRREHRLSLR